MKYLLRYLAPISILFFGVPGFAQSAGEVKPIEQGAKVVRIGVLMPKVELKEAEGEVEPGAALRNTYGALLNSETIQIVALDARLTTLALEEAASKECDFILNLSLVQEEKKSGGGLFDRVARSTGRSATYETAQRVPGGGGAGERIARSAAQSAIINTGYTISNLKYKVDKNDKFELDYFLTTSRGQTVLEKSIDAKAKRNNDDKVLMGLIEESANDIVKAIRKP